MTIFYTILLISLEIYVLLIFRTGVSPTLVYNTVCVGLPRSYSLIQLSRLLSDRLLLLLDKDTLRLLADNPRVCTFVFFSLLP